MNSLGTGANVRCTGLWLALLLLLCLCVSSWGACTQKNASRVCRSYGGSGNTLNCGSLQYEHHLSGGNFSCGIWGDGSNRPCTFLSTSISENNSSYTRYEIQYLTCDTQAEADSAACANDPALPNCGPQQDTETMEQLQSRCGAIGGESHYQYNDQGNVVGYCDICQKDENGNYTNEHVKTQYNDYKESCCQVGKAPNASNFKCLSSNNACTGANCEWLTDPSVTKGGGIGYSQIGYTPGICEVNISVSIDGTIAGCEDDENINSSGSGGANSSSSESEGQSSSAGEGSSASMDENVQTIADGVGAIIDSLHKIIVIDSMNRTYDSLVAVFTSTIASLVDEINQKEFGGGDTTIINVPRDTNVINVNVGQAAVVTAIESMSAQEQAIANKILAEADTSNELLKGILSALDTSKYNDSNLVKIMTDTTGGPSGDTSGWGGKLDSMSSWLKDSTFLKNIFGSGSGALCDTTGGHKCESLGGSLSSASGSWGSTYKALGDSLTQGAVADSLARWESMLTNNGVITGSGSNSCPSVFSRQYTINIGSGIEVQTPALGQYVCATIPGTSITFWTLARVVIRAMVAITCMWWLYGAVTGVKNDGGDDD